MIKDGIMAVVITAAAALGFTLWLSPYWSFGGLLKAVAAHDEATVEALADIPALRAALPATSRSPAADESESGASIVGSALGISRSAPRAANTAPHRTPPRLLTGAASGMSVGEAPGASTGVVVQREEFLAVGEDEIAHSSRFEVASAAFKSMSEHWLNVRTVSLVSPQVGQLVMQRQGFDWKVIAITSQSPQ